MVVDYDTHDGTGVRDYIHVVDLAIGHLKALNRHENDAGLHIYNLGTGTGYSVLDMVKAFEQANILKFHIVLWHVVQVILQPAIPIQALQRKS